ncbi:N-succinylarginine dihydrolase, partial [Vibrio parahaemolyticus]|uniref:N-succinylarginine dihydrolase n=1 Tax=Vibrio parahaemolyticus TaxID=670 RepID=UPI001EEC8A29|nr:N-succinylarginine dihydrolase [Vibrio parahaemolyticus]
LCRSYGEQGVEVFVYGRQAFGGQVEPQKFPARQTREASEAVARLHQLDESQTVFLQQNPDVIDKGVFHNDVIAVSNGPVLFHHQEAFIHQAQVFDEIRHKLGRFDCEFTPIEVPSAKVSVEDAVGTYLFNSQLLTKADKLKSGARKAQVLKVREAALSFGGDVSVDAFSSHNGIGVDVLRNKLDSWFAPMLAQLAAEADAEPEQDDAQDA